MKKYIKYLGIVLIGFSVTLGIMYLTSRGNISNEINSKQMAVFIEEDGKYKVSKTIPTKGYVFNEERSFCNNGANPTWNSLTNGLKISNLTKDKTSCMLYFDLTGSKKVLADLKREESTEELDFSKTDEEEHLDENGKSLMFKAEDDFGESYYFRGRVNDNWIKFGTDENEQPIWWRIIRINGDGTIRLIYTGTGLAAPGTTDSKTNAITSQTFNETRNNNKYVGYQFDDTDKDKRGHTSPSNAYTQLTQWFKDNLEDEWDSGNGHIDTDEGFCGDRSSSTSPSTSWLEDGMQESGGTGSSESTHYGAYLRLVNSTKQPTLKCSTKGNKDADYYTYTNAKGIKQNETDTTINGTKSLTSPVGLITADEVAFAGGVYGQENKNYWLYTNSEYWTMSPSNFSTYAFAFLVTPSGSFTNGHVTSAMGLRPVINLKSSTTFTGSGVIDDPYTIES